MPQISIIVPVYKVEPYIRRCLDSILAQTFTDWECILVDDGSPDNSGVICDEYAAKDSRFKVIHQENQGAVAARMNALAVVTGEYFIFVDADDYIASQMLEKMHEVAVSLSGDMVVCDVAVVLPENEVKMCSLPKPQNGEDALRSLLSCRLPGWLCNKLIKRAFWDECDVQVDRQCSAMEDVYISVQLYANNPHIAHVDFVGYYYNRCNEHAMTSGSNHVEQSIPNMIHAADYLKDRGLSCLYEQDFHVWAMKVKMCLLRIRGIKIARALFPKAHQRLSVYPDCSCMKKLAYWFAFNGGLLGGIIYYIWMNVSCKIKVK